MRSKRSNFLIIVASVAIGFFILVQNPKGGGLAGNIAGFNSQYMGVKQTTDVLEKGTWIFVSALALLCLFSSLFIGKVNTGSAPKTKAATTQTTPATPAPAPATPTK